MNVARIVVAIITADEPTAEHIAALCIWIRIFIVIAEPKCIGIAILVDVRGVA
jgi:hypothetical protein